jgi:hypothetical protein
MCSKYAGANSRKLACTHSSSSNTNTYAAGARVHDACHARGCMYADDSTCDSIRLSSYEQQAASKCLQALKQP